MAELPVRINHSDCVNQPLTTYHRVGNGRMLRRLNSFILSKIRFHGESL